MGEIVNLKATNYITDFIYYMLTNKYTLSILSCIQNIVILPYVYTILKK